MWKSYTVALLSPLRIKVRAVSMVKGLAVSLSLLNLPIDRRGRVVQNVPPVPPNTLALLWET